jgi:hypothetical protein
MLNKIRQEAINLIKQQEAERQENEKFEKWLQNKLQEQELKLNQKIAINQMLAEEF